MKQKSRAKHIVSRLSTHQVSKLLDIQPATLRLYEMEGLLKPTYIKGSRYFTQEHLGWLACLKTMIQDEGISIPGLTRLLKLCPCWEILDCPEGTRTRCSAKYHLQESSEGIPFEDKTSVPKLYACTHEETQGDEVFLH